VRWRRAALRRRRHPVRVGVAAQLLRRLKLDAEEVQAAMFLSSDFVTSFVNSEQALQNGHTSNYDILVVDKEHESGQRIVEIDSHSVYQCASSRARRAVEFHSERVTFGTHYALSHWLQKARRRAAL